jgi:LysR family carnitine catabolism transcriptional activator
MNISVVNLRAFLKVAELGGFTAAARALSISQPALSRAIRAMEEEIGARLFDRDTRKLALTPTGAELREVAIRITTEIDLGFASLADFLKSRRGRVTVSILPSVAAVLFPNVVGRFREFYPGVDISVRDGSQGPLLDDVMRGRADFAVTMDPATEGDFQFLPLLSDEFVFVGGPADNAATKHKVTWTVFKGRPFIALASGSSIRRMTDAAFQGIGLVQPPRHECGFPATAISLVQAGLGVTALPRLTMPDVFDPALTIRELRAPRVSRRIGIVRRPGQSLPPSAERLIVMLRHEALRVQSRLDRAARKYA